MKKTIEHAALRLPRSARNAFIDAWKSTEAGDFYDGRLADYLSVIGSELRHRKNALKEYEHRMKEISRHAATRP